MRWPPNKSWTSIPIRLGYRHFVAINYGGKGLSRWVGLVSVIDGKIRLRVSWQELKDPSQWISGWRSLPREESIDSSELQNIDTIENDLTCLHPSRDSGLLIPREHYEERAWAE